MSDIDSVNLQNGNLTVRIPVLSYPQRGLQEVSYSLLFNGKQLQPKTVCDPSGDCTDLMLMKPSPYAGLGFQLVWDQRHPLITNYTKGQYVWCQLGDCNTVHTSFESRAITDATGASHPFALVSSGLWRTADGSGYQLRSIDNQGDVEVVLPNGISGTSACAFVDPNGNELCAQDTVGRQIFSTLTPFIPPPASWASTANIGACPSTLPLSTTSANTFTVPAVNGGNATYTECYATLSVITTYNLTTGDLVTANMPVLQALILPDQTAWVFSYESATGNLTQIQTPTGGSIQYTWGGMPDSPCSLVANYNGFVVAKTVNSNDGTGSHTWSYNWTATGGYNWSATVTDPTSNDTVTNFLPVIGTSGNQCSYFPQTVTSYQGPASNGSVLKTVTTQYTSPAVTPPYLGIVGVYPTSVTTSENGLVSQTQTDYDSGFTYQSEDLGWVGTPTPLLYGKVLAKREYDYGSGQPGSLLKTTSTQYLAFTNAQYLNANLLNLVSSVTITDGAGNLQGETQYGYDETTPASSGVTTNLTTPPSGSIRGNLTSTRTLLMGSTPVTTTSCSPNLQSGYLVDSTAHFDTGEVSQTTNACGQSTTYGYDLAYSGAYQTSVQGPLLPASTKTYDLNTGSVLSQTDVNGQTTTYGYYDPLARITDVTSPDIFSANGTQSHTHFDYTPTTVQVTEQLGSGPRETLATVDGFGKLLTTQLITDPSGPTYIQHGYDAMGRESSTGNPTRCAPPGTGCAEATAGTTQHIYDALGRETQTIPPDGSSSTDYISTTYQGNEIAVQDQAHVTTARTYDALGRITQAYETSMGWFTNYSYDILGDLTCVEQHGSSTTGTGCSASPSQDATSPWRVRRFTYDSLGHLLTAKNPESGQTPTTYTYDAVGNVITKTDGRGITITYSYDALNRLTGKTYSDGEPAVSYTYDANGSGNYGIGRRTGMTDGSGSTSWTYDTMGRVASETRNIGTASHSTSTLYYLNGSPYQITYPSGNVVTYGLGGDGRLLGASDSSGVTYASSLTYAPPGLLAAGVLSTGITLTNSYNNRLQPSLLQASTASNTLLSLGYNFGLGVNDNGNVYHLTNYKDTTRNLTFTYDNANRLLTAHGDQSSAATSATDTVQVFGFESPRCVPSCDSGTISITVGPTTESTYYGQGDSSNMVAFRLASAFTSDSTSVVSASESAGTLTLTSKSTGSAMNSYAVSSASVSNSGNTPAFTATPHTATLTGGTNAGLASGQLNESYAVDAWGNMTSSGTYSPIQPYTMGVDNRIVGYSYDGAGNLLSDGSAGLCGSGAKYGWNAESQITCFGSYSYTYDGDGQRVGKSSGTLYWAGGLAESDLSGNLTSEYIFLAGKRIARRDVATGNVYYYLSDNLGSSSVVTNAAGVIENESDFYPFGIENPLTTNPANQHFKYTSKERDAESGLDYFGARYYSSNVGRWMSPDWAMKPEAVPYSSLSNPQSLNLYSYVGNNPLGSVDADGHMLVNPDNPNEPCPALMCSAELMTNANNDAQDHSPKPAQQQIGQDPTFPTAVAPSPHCGLDGVMDRFFPQTWGDMASLALMVPTDGIGELASPLARGLDLTAKLTEEGASDAEKVAKITEEADKLYPSKAGKFEAHHDMPQALGGAKNGPTTRLPASYHQMITNMTRTLTQNYTDFNAGAKAIMEKVYSYFPIRW